MTDGGQRSIAKIRTFNGDVSRARNAGSETPATEPAPFPSPAAAVTPGAAAVPPSSQAPKELRVPTMVSSPVVPPSQSTRADAPVPLAAKPVLVDATAITNALSDFKAIPASNLAAQNFDAIDDPLASEGTIVSDKRRKRFRLLPAIGTAMSDWANDTKSNLTKKEASATVTKAESRIDTLKAAALASHQVPQDDHGAVVKRLTEVPRTTVSTGANIKAATTVAAPTWKHVADGVTVEEPEAPEPARRAQIPVTDPSTPKPAPAPIAVPETKTPVASLPAMHTPAPVTRLVPPAEQFRTPAPMLTQEPVPAPEQPAPRTFAAPTPSRRTMTLMFTAVILGASMLGIGATTLWYIGTKPAPDTAVRTLSAPSLFATELQTPIALNPDRIVTLNELLGATLNTTETQQLYVTTEDEAGMVRPAEASEILTGLSFRVPGNFSRSIRAMSFGSYVGQHPFIVMRSSDFSTAFAGMLAWETTMSADLMPLFGSAVNESFDPTARTATQVRAAFFRDTIMANLSTRVLVDSTNTERIVYGFVKPNIILIAPNEATFTAIAPLIIETP